MYPWCFHPLIAEDYSPTESALVAQQLPQEGEANLDTYSRGLRMWFAPQSKLLSHECRTADFAAQGYGADCVERANAELIASMARRALGRHMAPASQEAVLKQLTAVTERMAARTPRRRAYCLPLRSRNAPSAYPPCTTAMRKALRRCHTMR